MKKINHARIFFHAIRSAILFIAGFLIYEILVELEKLWNEVNPENTLTHFQTRKGIKFIVILVVDLLILYGLFVLFDVEI
jgi:hypothetical protein